MNYWLVKSEPSTWSWDQQVAKGAKGEAWTGVRNYTARQNLVKMKKGDRAFFYHSNEGKEIVGIAEIVKEAYPDPTDKSRKVRLRRYQGGQAAEDAGDDGRDQGRQAPGRHGAGKIFAAVGAAGDGGRSGRSSARWAGCRGSSLRSPCDRGSFRGDAKHPNSVEEFLVWRFAPSSHKRRRKSIRPPRSRPPAPAAARASTASDSPSWSRQSVRGCRPRRR